MKESIGVAGQKIGDLSTFTNQWSGNAIGKLLHIAEILCEGGCPIEVFADAKLAQSGIGVLFFNPGWSLANASSTPG